MAFTHVGTQFKEAGITGNGTNLVTELGGPVRVSRIFLKAQAATTVAQIQALQADGSTWVTLEEYDMGDNEEVAVDFSGCGEFRHGLRVAEASAGTVDVTFYVC